MTGQTAWIVLALLLVAGAIPRPKPDNLPDRLYGWAWSLLFIVLVFKAAQAS